MHRWTTQHCCLLCQRCLEPLSRVKPALPPRARCNDMWGGRLPEPIRVLTYAETKVLQLARACVSMKRAGKPENLRNSFLRRSAHWVSSGKNIVAYPQRPHKFVSAWIIFTPEELCETLCVQFVGADRGVVREDPSLKVSVSRLRGALQWLAAHNPFWRKRLRDDCGGGVLLPASVEKSLAMYRAGGCDSA